MNRCPAFRQRLLTQQPTIGTFVKTPSPQIAEVLGLTDLDLCCLDAEHAPFGRQDTDLALSLLRAADMPSLVRVPDDSATELRNALDAGATGVLVPHVTSAAQAERIVQHTHFGEGGRGYAGSTRAAGFTTKAMPDHLHDSAAETAVVVQIEDLAALDQVDAIAAVEGVDALFIGRVDLAVAMGEAVDANAVVDAVSTICRTAVNRGTAVGMFTPRVEELSAWAELGASLFILGSDQSFVLQGARTLRAQFDEQLSQPS